MILKKKKYNIFDSISICFKIVPFTSLFLVLISIVSGLLPFLFVTFNSRFVDSAISYINNKESINEIINSIFILLLLFIIVHFNTVFIQILNTRITIGLRTKFQEEIIKKCILLKYEYIENEKTCNLFNRIIQNPGFAAVQTAFSQIISFLVIFINIIGVSYYIYMIKWWLIPLVIVLTIPLIIVSYLGGKDTYNAIRWNTDLARKSDYIEFDMLRGRDLATERTLFGYTKHFNEVFEGCFQETINVGKKVRFKWLIRSRIVTFFVICNTIFITIFALTPLRNGSITFGLFISIVSAVFQLQDTLTTQVSERVSKLSESGGYFKDISEFINLKEEEQV